MNISSCNRTIFSCFSSNTVHLSAGVRARKGSQAAEKIRTQPRRQRRQLQKQNKSNMPVVRYDGEPVRSSFSLMPAKSASSIVFSNVAKRVRVSTMSPSLVVSLLHRHKRQRIQKPRMRSCMDAPPLAIALRPALLPESRRIPPTLFALL